MYMRMWVIYSKEKPGLDTVYVEIKNSIESAMVGGPPMKASSLSFKKGTGTKTIMLFQTKEIV